MVIAVLIYGGIIALVLVIVGQWYTDRQFIRNQLIRRIGSTETSSSIAEYQSRIAEKKADYLEHQALPFEGLTAFSAELNRYFDEFRDRVSHQKGHGIGANSTLNEALSLPWESPYEVKVLRTVRFWLYLHDASEALRGRGHQVLIMTPNQTLKLGQELAQSFEQFFFQLKSLLPTGSSLEITGSRNAESLSVDIVISWFNEGPSGLEEMIRSFQSTDLKVSTTLSKSAQLEIQVLISNIGE